MHCFKKAMHFLSVLQKKYNVSIFLISDLLYQQYKKSNYGLSIFLSILFVHYMDIYRKKYTWCTRNGRYRVESIKNKGGSIQSYVLLSLFLFIILLRGRSNVVFLNEFIIYFLWMIKRSYPRTIFIKILTSEFLQFKIIFSIFPKFLLFMPIQ